MDLLRAPTEFLYNRNSDQEGKKRYLNPTNTLNNRGIYTACALLFLEPNMIRIASRK